MRPNCWSSLRSASSVSDAFEPGVVRDLVVARERRVHGWAPLHHVGEHAVDDHVAHDHAERCAQERVLATSVAPRTHVAPFRAGRGRPLEDHFPAEENESPHDVETVRQKRPVTGIRMLLRVDPADGEDHVIGFSGQEVAAARAPIRQQPAAGAVTAFDLGAVRGSRTRHQRPGLLLHPAEGRDVLVRAEQNSRLARSRLRRQVGLPLGERVRAVGEPARHVRRAAVTHRPLQHR